ncbi:MAG: glycerate kinase [Gammaproteobacteria bacterium]
MKIVLAPDSFKESLAAAEVAAALAEGLALVLPAAHLVCVPVADGGEGTLDALLAATGGHEHHVSVHGPRAGMVSARLGVLGGGDVAVIESAQAAGLALVPPDARDPLRTTSYGIGELVLAALDLGLRRFVVCLGGTATVDGGAGMLQALGAVFLDARGRSLAAPLRGADLAQVASVRLDGFDARIAASDFQIACDVDNPLTGPLGAAAVFGPQKGATPAQVPRLDAGLDTLHRALAASTGRQVAEVPGAGAAGGLGAAAMACLPGALRPGIELVMAAVDLAGHLADADVVVTGEGRVDSQTLHGKAPAGVARLARTLGVPVVAIGGSLPAERDLLLAPTFDAFEAVVTAPCTLAEALADARPMLVAAGVRLGRWLKLLDARA